MELKQIPFLLFLKWSVRVLLVLNVDKYHQSPILPNTYILFHFHLDHGQISMDVTTKNILKQTINQHFFSIQR